MRNALGSKDFHVISSWLPSITQRPVIRWSLMKHLQRSSVKVDVRSGLGHLMVQALPSFDSFPLRFNAAVRPLWQQG